MVPSRRSCAPAFAPSPPLSATAGTSDNEFDDHDKIPRDQPPRTDSSPASLPSRAVSQAPSQSLPSAVSSFTAADERQEGPKPLEGGRAHWDEQHSDCSGGDLARAFSVIKASWEEQLPDLTSPDWYTLHISPSQYEELYRRLGEEDPDLLDYFENRLRFDYDPDRGLLVLRLMASAVHEYLQDRIMDEIKAQLVVHATGEGDSDFASLLSDILSVGQAKVKLATSRRFKKPVQARKRPDGQFRFRGTSAPLPHLPYHFEGSSTPQFLIEVGNSQKAKALKDLAQDYYEKSRGPGIKTILTIDTEYIRPEQRKKAGTGGNTVPNRTAAYCLYRGPDRIHHDVVFRSSEGQQVDGGPIRLFVPDFIPDQVLEQLPPTLRARAETTSIELPHTLLYKFLLDADYAQVMEDKDEEPTPEPEPQAAAASTHTSKRVRWDAESGADESDEGGSPQPKRPRTRSALRETVENLPARPRTRSMTQSSPSGRRQTRSMSRGRAGPRNEAII